MVELKFGDSRVRWPVIIADGLDLTVIDNLESLNQVVEQDDVGDLVAYDSSGQRLDLLLTAYGIEAAAQSKGSEDAEALSELIRDSLRASGRDVEPETALDMLIAEVRRARGR